MKDGTIGIPALYFEVGVLDNRDCYEHERIDESKIPFEMSDLKKQYVVSLNSYVFTLIPFEKIDGLTFRDAFNYKGFPKAFILRASRDIAFSVYNKYNTLFYKFALFPVRVNEEDADKEISSFFEEKFSYLLDSEGNTNEKRAFLTFLERYRYSTEELIEKYPIVAEMYPEVARKLKRRTKMKHNGTSNSFNY